MNRFAEIYTPIVVLLSVALALWSSNLTRGLTVARQHGTLRINKIIKHMIFEVPSQAMKIQAVEANWTSWKFFKYLQAFPLKKLRKLGLQVLVSACPCAVVAAAPVVQSCAFVRLLSDLQVLVKDQQFWLWVEFARYQHGKFATPGFYPPKPRV